ncbi:helix-turn-helix transcriptional regulator [Cellulomonas fimi]|uniref:HTH cro/C1-type domain-containing protein n=1 Tax=Cellulomonas fimi TaxID=1708 RepID=A0A7Y0LXT9_CELFI|nr:helix-turn-helix transcriptional regulator [Cellulomonas fimi]NMR20232.1 hypothetical protein [Cellulomonas fimi]
MAIDAREAVAVARRARSRNVVSRLDYLRELRRLAGSLTQVELARNLGVSQPTISSALKTASGLPEPRPGFSGAGPYEIAQRYAAGDLSRGQLIDELSRWEYRPWVATDGYDCTTGDEGEWGETVAVALRDGLLDEETYDAILDRRDGLGR